MTSLEFQQIRPALDDSRFSLVPDRTMVGMPCQDVYQRLVRSPIPSSHLFQENPRGAAAIVKNNRIDAEHLSGLE